MPIQLYPNITILDNTSVEVIVSSPRTGAMGYVYTAEDIAQDVNLEDVLVRNVRLFLLNASLEPGATKEAAAALKAKTGGFKLGRRTATVKDFRLTDGTGHIELVYSDGTQTVGIVRTTEEWWEDVQDIETFRLNVLVCLQTDTQIRNQIASGTISMTRVKTVLDTQKAQGFWI